MNETMKQKGPYVLWLAHNSRCQIDGRRHYGGLFDDLDGIINELSPKMDSLSANKWNSRDEVVQAFGPEPDELPDWLDDDLTWPVYECDGGTFASEEEMYDYVADRLEVGSFELLDSCDAAQLRDIAETEFRSYGVRAIPPGLLVDGESADADLDYGRNDGVARIRVTTADDDERFLAFDDYLVAAVISELYSLYRGERSAADVYWQMASEQKRAETCTATAVYRARQEREAREVEAFQELYRRCKSQGITREKFDASLASDDKDPTHLPAQIRGWLGRLDVDEVRAGFSSDER